MTSRTVTLTIAALLLYFFAIQTQTGWLYLMSAALVGIVAAAGVLNRVSLGKIAVTRAVGGSPEADLHEGGEVIVRLVLRNSGRGPAVQVQAMETCPLAAPDDVKRDLRLFLPELPSRSTAEVEYSVMADRRGVHRFPPLSLASRAPFGLFRRAGQAGEPQSVLVYPELRPLRRLDLLDRQPALALVTAHPGLGAEVMGVRPFRSGDSPRHIHWRSVARTGQLISKEFTDETSPGLALVLDTRRYPYARADSKHTPFEWAVKIALSLGDYALKRGYPLTIVADDSALAAPPGPISRRALLEYLARVQPQGARPAADVIADAARSPNRFAAVMLSWPDPDAIAPLLALRAGGAEVLAVLLEAESFPGGGPSARSLEGALRAGGVDARLVRFGEDWVEGLEGASPFPEFAGQEARAGIARAA